jgi:hypothetical protein
MSEPQAEPGGLHNPSVRRERTDVDTKAIMTFVAALAVGIAVVMLAMWGMFVLFWHQETATKKPTYPLAVQERQQTSVEDRLPPSPRIEGLGPTKPEHTAGRNELGTARELNEAQEAILNSYSWTNAEKNAARIPIEEAIKRLGKPGALPARNDGGPVDEYLTEPSQTSSGQRARGQTP